MEKRVALLCDSSADISEAEAKELGIHVLRMPIIIDNETFTEGVDIFDEDILKALKADKKISTTQPSPGSMLALWDELLKEYDQVLYFPLSSGLSSTCANAINFARDYQGKVVVIDSTFACYPIVCMLLMARDMLEKGYSAEQIKERFEQEANMYAILIPENLNALKNGGRISPAAAKLAGMLKIHPLLTVENGKIDVYDKVRTLIPENLNALKNGGRISPAAAKLAGMLKIHPLLTVENGKIDVYDKVRTLSKAYQRGIEAVTKDIDPNDYEWMIIHAYNETECLKLKEQLEKAVNSPVQVREFKAVIASHTGEGTIGFGRYKKLDY